MVQISLSFALPLLLSTLVASSSLPVAVPGKICDGTQTVTSTQYIGVDNNVKLEHIKCNLAADFDTIEGGGRVQARQNSNDTTPNVCGANCTTHCFTPSGGGPDPNDCHIIADALRFQSQNVAPVFTVANGTSDILSLSFATCTSFFLNQATTPLNYCRTDFASLIDFIAPNCQATQNAHGGLCVANDGRWFVQVQHA